eukprot:symbB.v1.2.015647.t1/scaffold1142.1/size245703/16
MLVLDPATGKYSEELTPSYGRTDLRAFLTDALQDVPADTKLFCIPKSLSRKGGVYARLGEEELQLM